MGNYGSFYSLTTETQAPPTVGTAEAMLTSQVAAASGVDMDTTTGSITVDESGVYNIQFSVQLSKTVQQDEKVDIWLAKKPVGGAFAPIPDSNTEITLSGRMAITEREVYGWNFMIPINAGEEVQLMWTTSRGTTTISGLGTQTSPTRPAVPPLILTVHQVG